MYGFASKSLVCYSIRVILPRTFEEGHFKANKDEFLSEKHDLPCQHSSLDKINYAKI